MRRHQRITELEQFLFKATRDGRLYVFRDSFLQSSAPVPAAGVAESVLLGTDEAALAAGGGPLTGGSHSCPVVVPDDTTDVAGGTPSRPSVPPDDTAGGGASASVAADSCCASGVDDTAVPRPAGDRDGDGEPPPALAPANDAASEVISSSQGVPYCRKTDTDTGVEYVCIACGDRRASLVAVRSHFYGKHRARYNPLAEEVAEC